MLLEKIGAAGILEAAKNVAATNLTIEKTAAASILEATKNAAAIMAAGAACCCEVKAAVHADGQQTRDLINSVQASNLAVQLADSKAEILALRLRVPALPI